jgi:Cof subfamily protein (haloacid dehalogenase superfamily)
MIQLVITDLDGTLLNDQKELPEEFGKTEQELRKNGVLFAVASGRPYISMSRIMHQFSDHILFIAENGGLIRYRNKVIKSSPMTPASVQKLIVIARQLSNCHILLCGENTMWYESRNSKFIEESVKYYDHMTYMEDLMLLNEPVIKFTICDLENAETNSYVKMQHLGDEFSMAVSGLRWLDITAKEVNKGEALKFMLEFLGIPAENTLAFGDYFNDKEMLQVAGHSYLMKNAHPGMISYAKKISPYTNNDGGVIKHINEIIDLRKNNF